MAKITQQANQTSADLLDSIKKLKNEKSSLEQDNNMLQKQIESDQKR